MAKANPDGEIELDKLKKFNHKANTKHMNTFIRKKGKRRK